MSKLATFVVALGALVLAFVTLSPNSAEAGWRRWGGPGVNVYVGPRYGCMAHATTTGLMPITVIPTAIIPIGAAATGAAGTRHERLRARFRLSTRAAPATGVALVVFASLGSVNGE